MYESRPGPVSRCPCAQAASGCRRMRSRSLADDMSLSCQGRARNPTRGLTAAQSRCPMPDYDNADLDDPVPRACTRTRVCVRTPAPARPRA